MTDKQPEALQHVARLERSPQPFDREAAAELRRLHEENEALRARLAQPEPEPEMWVHDKRGWVGLHEQPQREWQGLTDEEINDLAAIKSGMPLYRAIEQAIKEKNA